MFYLEKQQQAKIIQMGVPEMEIAQEPDGFQGKSKPWINPIGTS